MKETRARRKRSSGETFSRGTAAFVRQFWRTKSRKELKKYLYKIEMNKKEKGN